MLQIIIAIANEALLQNIETYYNHCMTTKILFKQIQINYLKPGKEYTKCIFDNLEIKRLDLQECKFIQCSFAKSDLTGTKFNAAVFDNCNFSNAKIDGCNFFSAVFRECKLLGLKFSRVSSLIGATFTKCSFDYADMRALNLSRLNLENSSFIETDFSLANLENTSFINSQMINCNFNQVKYKMTDFRGAILQAVSLKDNLKGIIITPQQLKMLAEEIGIHIMDCG